MRLGAGDLLMLLMVGVVGPSVGFGVLSDPGLGWHLRVPDVVVADGFVTADPFSDPPGRYWLANQWLGELPFWAGWRLAGWGGVAAVALGLLLVTYRLLFHWLRTDGVAWPVALALTVLACAAGYVGWLARPTMLTTLFTAVVVRTLVRFRDGAVTGRRLAWLVPLFAVWVNCHGGFVAGLACVGLAAGVELVGGLARSPKRERGKRLPARVGCPPRSRFGLRAESRTRFTVLAAVGVGCGVATLANPYGWRVYPWVFGLLGDPYFMNLNGEWKSPDFHDPAAARFEWLLLLTVGLLAVSRHRPNLVLLALSLFWLHQSLQGRRFSPIGVLVLAPLAGRLAADLPGLPAGWVEDWRPVWAKELRGGWLGPLLAVAGLAGWAWAVPLTPDAPAVPEPALRELLDRRRPGEPVFHSPNHGGHLTLHGWPAFRTTLDDRNEVHGRAAYERHLAVVAVAPGWEMLLDESGAVWVVGERGTPLADRLAERPDRWQAVYADAEATLFRRK